MSFSFKGLGVWRRTTETGTENLPGDAGDHRLGQTGEPSSTRSDPDLRLVIEKIADLERVLREVKQAVLPGSEYDPAPGPGIDDVKIRRIIRARRIREQQLGPQLFADPAWDLLLEAFAADLRQERMTVPHLCRASRVPETTALRWIKLLEKDGWLGKVESSDGRKWMELSAEGSAKLRRYFDAIGPVSFL